jgi:uncharacterized protein (TIGR00255 family)
VIFLQHQLRKLSESDFEVIKKSVLLSLDSLIADEKKRRQRIRKRFKKRIKSIEKYLDLIEKESQPSVGEHFAKYKEKVKNLLEENVNINNDRLETELALMAERADITEECVRLRSHIKFFNSSIDKEEDPGRKLKFSLPGNE